MPANTVPRGARWAPVSGSANIDLAYRQLWSDPDKAYRYICWCHPPFPESDDEGGEDEKDEEEEDEDEDEEKEDACDGGHKCICGKPAQEHPGHKWITTYAGRRKFLCQVDMARIRDPANFDMHTFNDHAALGIAEVIENLLLDFVEANGNWREQWVVCEALSFFLQTDLAADLLEMGEVDTIIPLVRLVGRTFLAMLAQLERQHRLGPDSEVKNLGLIMPIYIKTARDMQISDLLNDDDEETVELKLADGSTEKYTFDLGKLDEYILGYAERHSIAVPDAPQDVQGAAENLPARTVEDPWDTAESFRRYESVQGTMNGPGEKPAIGGDRYDITAWSSAERRSASFRNRDPFSKKEIAALKLGFMLGFE